jgi:hypothetical protein
MLWDERGERTHVDLNFFGELNINQMRLRTFTPTLDGERDDYSESR